MPFLLQSEPTDYLSQGLLLIGLAFVTVWLLMRVMRRRRDPAVDTLHLDADERRERMKQARGLRGDLESVMVEVEEMARRFASQIDAKSVALDRLIDKADARIAELKTLERKLGLESDPSADPSSDPPPTSVKAGQAGQADDESQFKTGPAASSAPATTADPSSPASPDGDAANKHAGDHQADGAEATDASAPDPLARSIYRLADAGHDAPSISRLLSEHVGKIELILALRRAK